ncbi:MAG TPA: BON domain-containing protein [Gemmatimonadaceae bacterium]
MAYDDYGRGRDFGNRGVRDWSSEYDRGYPGRGDWELGGGRYGWRGSGSEPAWRGSWEPYYGVDTGRYGAQGGYDSYYGIGGYGGYGGYGGPGWYGGAYGGPYGAGSAGGYYGYPNFGYTGYGAGGAPGYGPGYGWWSGAEHLGWRGYPGYGGSSYGYGAGGHGGYGGAAREGWMARDRGYGSELGRGELGRGSLAGRGPRGYRRSDERIEEEVNEQLTRHPEIDASDIDVKVNNGEVTLTGRVDDRHEKRLAEDIVEACSGVTDVHNQLRVGRAGSSRAEREVGRTPEQEGRAAGERARGGTRGASSASAT